MIQIFKFVLVVLALVAISQLNSCDRVKKIDDSARGLCDSLDLLFESADAAIGSEEWKFLKTGLRNSLQNVRTVWQNYLEKASLLDTLNLYQRLSTDTSLSHRLHLAHWNTVNSQIRNHPSIAGALDSLTRALALVRQRLPEMSDTTISVDSLPGAGERRRLYRRYYAFGETIREWPARIARLHNQRAKGVGYNSQISLNLTLIGIVPDRLESILNRIDSATEAPYKQLLKSLEQRLSVGALSAADLHYYKLYMAPNSPNQPLMITCRRAQRAAFRSLAQSGLSVKNQPLYVDSQSLDVRLRYPLLVTVHAPDDARLLLGSLRGSVPLEWMFSLARELGRGMYLLNINQLSYLNRRSVDPLWESALGAIFTENLQTVEYLKPLLRLSDDQWIRFSEWYAGRRLIELRELIALIRFEIDMYENPNRDLNDLYWNRYEDILHVNADRSAYPWANKFSLTTKPATQFCEIISMCVVQQIRSHGIREFDVVTDNPAFGLFVKRNLFAPGASLTWSDQLLETVGERLNINYFLLRYSREITAH